MTNIKNNSKIVNRLGLLVLIMLCGIIIYGMYLNTIKTRRIEVQGSQYDSLTSAFYSLQTEHRTAKNNWIEYINNNTDWGALKDSIDSSHGRQIRYLQWHVNDINHRIEIIQDSL